MPQLRTNSALAVRVQKSLTQLSCGKCSGDHCSLPCSTHLTLCLWWPPYFAMTLDTLLYACEMRICEMPDRLTTFTWPIHNKWQGKIPDTQILFQTDHPCIYNWNGLPDMSEQCLMAKYRSIYSMKSWLRANGHAANRRDTRSLAASLQNFNFDTHHWKQ